MQFYDNDNVLFKRFMTDWTSIVQNASMRRLVFPKSCDSVDFAEGESIPEEMEEMGACLFTYNLLYTRCFAFYSDACFSGDDDLYEMTLNAWTALMVDCRILDGKTFKKHDSDLIFDAAAPRAKRNKTLSRVEFIAGLIRVARDKCGMPSLHQ